MKILRSKLLRLIHDAVINIAILIAILNLCIHLMPSRKEKGLSKRDKSKSRYCSVDANRKRYISKLYEQQEHTRKQVMDVGSFGEGYSSLLNLQDGDHLDIHIAHKILMKNLMSDDVYKKRENLEKFLKAAEFMHMSEKIKESHFEKFSEVLNTNNFNGQKFLVDNGMTPPDMMFRVKDMERAVQLSTEEKNLLTNMKWDLIVNSTQSEIRKIIHEGKELHTWQKFHNGISSRQLYTENDPVVDDVIKDLQTQTFLKKRKRPYQKGGTQLKEIFQFENGGYAVFKPLRAPRSQGSIPNIVDTYDIERHTSEIAGFHLDRILGFRKVPPAAGRVLNITKDLNRNTLETIFISPANNTCFTKKCNILYGTRHAVCGEGDLIEGSLSLYLPGENMTFTPYPVKTRSLGRLEEKKNLRKHCPARRNGIPKDVTPLNLDIMDTAIFDFLIDNTDRHVLERFYTNDSSSVRLDQGKGFGHAFMDKKLILEPLSQCCLLRYSTLKTIVKFDQGYPKLSDVMRESLSHDMLAPVLLEEHLLALDRRIKIVLRTLLKCKKKHENVVIDLRWPNG